MTSDDEEHPPYARRRAERAWPVTRQHLTLLRPELLGKRRTGAMSASATLAIRSSAVACALDDARPVRFVAAKRTVLLSATTLIAINIWTGAPLAALWVGSRVVGQRLLSMTAIFAVIATLAVLVTVMTFALIWLGARYDKLVGRPTGKPTPVPWLRSMRAEDTDLLRSERGNTALEMIVVGSTVTAIVSLEVWFCFFAGPQLHS